MAGQTELLTEMIIVGIMWLILLIFSTSMYIGHLGDRHWDTGRMIILASSISFSVLATIVEIAWLCMYLGLPV